MVELRGWLTSLIRLIERFFQSLQVPRFAASRLAVAGRADGSKLAGGEHGREVRGRLLSGRTGVSSAPSGQSSSRGDRDVIAKLRATFPRLQIDELRVAIYRGPGGAAPRQAAQGGRPAPGWISGRPSRRKRCRPASSARWCGWRSSNSYRPVRSTRRGLQDRHRQDRSPASPEPPSTAS